MPDFTPAPWSLGTVAVVMGDDYYEAPRDAVVYCDEDDNEIRIEGPDAPANARLIHAAPDLYAELTDLVMRFESACVLSGSDAEFARLATSKARAALAKARGDTAP